MADAVLTRMMTKVFDQKLGHCLRIADLVWNHWDELADKNNSYIDSPYENDNPQAFIPKVLDIKMDVRDASTIGNLLSCYFDWRRRPMKQEDIKMTKKKFMNKFCYYFNLALPDNLYILSL